MSETPVQPNVLIPSLTGALGIDPGSVAAEVLQLGARAYRERNREAMGAHFLVQLREVGDPALLEDPTIQALFPRGGFLSVSRYYDVTLVPPPIVRAIGTGEIEYTQAIRDGWLRRLWTWFQDYDIVADEDDIPLHFGHPLPIAELHCPHVEGARTWFRNTRGEEAKISLDVKVGAAGGGPAFRRRFTRSGGVTTTERCQMILAEVSGTYSRWRHRDTGDEIYLVAISGVDSAWSAQEIRGSGYSSHVCTLSSDLTPIKDRLVQRRARAGIDYSYIRPDRRSSGKGASTGSIEMEQERVYESRWPLAIGSHGELGVVTISSTFRHSVEWGYELPQGNAYLATYPSAKRWPPSWNWSR